MPREQPAQRATKKLGYKTMKNGFTLYPSNKRQLRYVQGVDIDDKGKVTKSVYQTAHANASRNHKAEINEMAEISIFNAENAGDVSDSMPDETGTGAASEGAVGRRQPPLQTDERARHH